MSRSDLIPAQEAAISAALAALDLDAKVRILSGQDMWSLPAVPDIGLDSVVMSDGPIGVRGTRWSAEDPSIALPSPTALAATWDPGLARRAGRLLGQEARRKGVHVLLAPTVNLHRSPLGGRHFECYSEDPLLTAAIGGGYVTGVQEQGVATTVKHFVANDAETDRFTVDNQVSERALREVYLAPFETIVRDAGGWGVMSAYNSVNGTTMSANGRLQHGVLKDEWGFQGAVVSDWLAARDTEATANGGLDVAMPAAANPWGARLVEAVNAGRVAAEVVDAAARRVLRLAARTGALRGAPASVAAADRPAPIDGPALAREIAVRSFVLAANDGILPLTGPGSVALIGALARDARVLGGGSATVFPAHIVSPLEGLTAALPDVRYATGADPRSYLAPATAPLWTGLRAVFRDGDGTTIHEAALATGAGRWMGMPPGVDPATLATVEISGTLTAAEAGTHRLGLRGIGQFRLVAGGETVFDDRVRPDEGDHAEMFLLTPPERRLDIVLDAGASLEVSLTHEVVLSGDVAIVSVCLGYGGPIDTDDALLDEAARVAAGADVAVVVVGTTDETESEGFDRTSLTLPGRQDDLVRRVAAANPRTVVVVNAGSPVELPWIDDVAAVLLVWFPGQEAGHALTDVLTGAAEPGGRLPTTWPVALADCPVQSTTPTAGTLTYDEGVFIGYRAWSRTTTAPRFPFGHGHGYTTWAYENLTIDGNTVHVTVRNTGTRPGHETIQIYLAPTTPDPDRPDRWLAGFATTDAAPGQAVTVTVDLPERAFQIWDTGWVTMPGGYTIEAGHSVADIRLAAILEIS